MLYVFLVTPAFIIILFIFICVININETKHTKPTPIMFINELMNGNWRNAKTRKKRNKVHNHHHQHNIRKDLRLQMFAYSVTITMYSEKRAQTSASISYKAIPKSLKVNFQFTRTLCFGGFSRIINFELE